jgi:hypothetical protein
LDQRHSCILDHTRLASTPKQFVLEDDSVDEFGIVENSANFLNDPHVRKIDAIAIEDAENRIDCERGEDVRPLDKLRDVVAELIRISRSSGVNPSAEANGILSSEMI